MSLSCRRPTLYKHTFLQICAIAGFVTGIALAVNPEGYLGSKGVELKHLVSTLVNTVVAQ